MASVSIRNVRKAYGAVEVIPSLSVEIEDGEFVILTDDVVALAIHTAATATVGSPRCCRLPAGR